MTIKYLGTGSNGGVPQVECVCENCSSARKNAKLKRLRCSVLVQTSNRNIILDCGPDFRQQLLNIDLALQQIDLIAISHLHFDHSGGLMELSAGKALEVPVLISQQNKKILNSKPEILFLENAGFIRLVSEEEAKEMGVSLIEVPHDPNFPTSAILVESGRKKIWYSPDIAEITPVVEREIKYVDLVLFDATFFDESVYPASELGHLPINKSAPRLATLNSNVVYIHINHSENKKKIETFLNDYNYKIAFDGLEIII